MKSLAVLGASGHGKVIADIAECCGWQAIEFYDDAWPSLQNNGAWNVVGDTGALKTHLKNYDGAIVAIGNNEIRSQKMRELLDAGAQIVSLIHPSAVVSRYAALGPGSVVMAGVVVNPDVTIGESAILNTCCSVDHDCELGDAVHVSPGACLAGGVCVGNNSWIGIGATVRQGIHIGSNVMVGAGAAVVSDLPDGVTAIGVPARFSNSK